jgi:hypothetical protein
VRRGECWAVEECWTAERSGRGEERRREERRRGGIQPVRRARWLGISTEHSAIGARALHVPRSACSPAHERRVTTSARILLEDRAGVLGSSRSARPKNSPYPRCTPHAALTRPPPKIAARENVQRTPPLLAQSPPSPCVLHVLPLPKYKPSPPPWLSCCHQPRATHQPLTVRQAYPPKSPSPSRKSPTLAAAAVHVCFAVPSIFGSDPPPSPAAVLVPLSRMSTRFGRSGESRELRDDRPLSGIANCSRPQAMATTAPRLWRRPMTIGGGSQTSRNAARFRTVWRKEITVCRV